MREVLIALLAGFIIASPMLFSGACTPAQRANARTALEVNRCVTTISLRHLDAGDNLKDPFVIARMASEITDECAPMVRGGE